MRIETDSVLPHARPLVFATYRDELPKILEYLPNVRSLEIAGRTDDGPRVRFQNVWHGAIELPSKLADALERRFLSWDDEAVWDEHAWVCEWTIRPHAFTEAVQCSGRTSFVDLGGDRTRIEVVGELALALDRVPGVPRFLAGSLGRTAEAFLIRHVTLNLTSVSDALSIYLTEDTVS